MIRIMLLFMLLVGCVGEPDKSIKQKDTIVDANESDFNYSYRYSNEKAKKVLEERCKKGEI